MFYSFFDWLTIAFLNVIGIVAAVHALMTKQDPRSALGWIAVCLFIPGFGVLLYLIFGINRIKATASTWQMERRFHKTKQAGEADSTDHIPAVTHRPNVHNFERMKHMGDRICEVDLLDGCHVEPLYTGSEAYPAMLKAIRNAKKTIFMSTYIFGAKGIGAEFVEALGDAVKRGVEVRVLIDGVGNVYSWPTAHFKLKRSGVPCALFLPLLRTFSQTLHLNLRNHRKLLLVDSEMAFTGGMNIHPENYDSAGHPPSILDIHFKVAGPVVAQLHDCFARSWFFSTKEILEPFYDFDFKPKGEMLCRGVDDGPNRAFPRYSLLVRSALSSAENSVRIMTPYLILDETMRTALTGAALRGIKIEILMPSNNNLSFVKSASEWLYPTLLKCDIQLYYRTGNFAHTKLLIMDDQYVLLGSSNLDNRSMHLNFEFDLEVFSEQLAQQMIEHFEEVKEHAQRLDAEWLQSRRFTTKLRNAFFNLFSPYM